MAIPARAKRRARKARTEAAMVAARAGRVVWVEDILVRLPERSDLEKKNQTVAAVGVDCLSKRCAADCGIGPRGMDTERWMVDARESRMRARLD